MRDYTPSQTIGPFFHFSLLDEDLSELVPPDHPSAIRIEGTVYNGAGEVVPDAMLEVWQADASGSYDHPDDSFSGFGRCGTDEAGKFGFVTVKPGPVPGPDGKQQAPHILLSVFARGLLKRLVTRVYFPDEETTNAADPVLSSIEDVGRRMTLVAREADDSRLCFDIHLQGKLETVFFDV